MVLQPKKKTVTKLVELASRKEHQDKYVIKVGEQYVDGMTTHLVNGMTEHRFSLTPDPIDALWCNSKEEASRYCHPVVTNFNDVQIVPIRLSVTTSVDLGSAKSEQVDGTQTAINRLLNTEAWHTLIDIIRPAAINNPRMAFIAFTKAEMYGDDLYEDENSGEFILERLTKFVKQEIKAKNFKQKSYKHLKEHRWGQHNGTVFTSDWESVLIMHKITNPGLEIIPLSVESIDAQIKELETATVQEIINGGRFVDLDRYREYLHDAKNESEEENDFEWDDDDDDPW